MCLFEKHDVILSVESCQIEGKRQSMPACVKSTCAAVKQLNRYLYIAVGIGGIENVLTFSRYPTFIGEDTRRG